MLTIVVRSLGATTVLQCQGRIVIGEGCAILRKAVLGQAHARTLVLDLARVDQIDAGGLGVLVGLREWTRSNTIRLTLMNVTNRVLQIVELTRVGCVFEFCSVKRNVSLAVLCAPGNTVGRRVHLSGLKSRAQRRTWLGRGSG
jgi:anti-anti-sigma factor